jgi:hypothetical protein
MEYDYEGNPVTSPGMIRIHIERGGESTTIEVPEDSSIQAVIEDGHLRGVDVANTRLNDAPASPSDGLQNGDTVTQIPKSGKQGN